MIWTKMRVSIVISFISSSSEREVGVGVVRTVPDASEEDRKVGTEESPSVPNRSEMK